MSVSDEDKAAAAATKTKANEAFKCEPTTASNSPGTHSVRFDGCSQTVHGRSGTIWTGIGAKPHRSHGMVESSIYSDELSEWRLFDFG